MRREIAWWLRGIWVLACLGIAARIAVGCAYIANETLRGECEFVWTLALAALGFPLTTVWWLAINGVAAACSARGIELDGSAFNIVMYSGLITVGYLQWFVLFPRIVQRLAPRPSVSRQD
jgi:hypothetical protein